MSDARIETGTAPIAREEQPLRRTPMLQNLTGDCDDRGIRMQTERLIQYPGSFWNVR
jgi:hypothetical protein